MITKCKYTTFILIIVISIFFSSELLFSNSDSTIKSKIWYNTILEDIQISIEDALFVGSEIINPSLDDVFLASASLGATYSTYLFDESINEWNRNTRTEATINAFNYIDPFGDITLAEVFAGSLYLTGLFAKKDQLRITGRMLLEALGLAGFIAITTRPTLGRARPYIGDYNQFEFFIWDDDYHAFPSGHTTVSFALAGILSHRIDKWWATSGLYTLATLAMMPRLNQDMHWGSDLIIGAALGSASAFVIIRAEKLRNEDKLEKKYSFGVYPGGISFKFRF